MIVDTWLKNRFHVLSISKERHREAMPSKSWYAWEGVRAYCVNTYVSSSTSPAFDATDRCRLRYWIDSSSSFQLKISKVGSCNYRIDRQASCELRLQGTRISAGETYCLTQGDFSDTSLTYFPRSFIQYQYEEALLFNHDCKLKHHISKYLKHEFEGNNSRNFNVGWLLEYVNDQFCLNFVQ